MYVVQFGEEMAFYRLINQRLICSHGDFYVLAENEERLAYLQLIRDVLVLLHAPAESATQDAEEIIEFETALANITMADDQRHDIAELYTKMTLGQMKQQLPNFDLQLFFNQVFREITDQNGTQIVFDENAEVVVYGIEFLRRLDKLLPEYEKRYSTGAFCSEKCKQDFVVMNVQKVRWHGCVTRINSLMPMATSSIH
ncbi:hypothetical protein OSTOST_25803, partial [Ostertagia ostertagi]